MALDMMSDADKQHEQPDLEEDFQEEPQIFPEHDGLSERFRKTLYYGRLPSRDRLSLPVSELCVQQFNDLGLVALEAKLNKLDMDKASEISRNSCASPTSLILALLYLERLRSVNPGYLQSVSSADLFLVSLMVASKFLNDDGEEDEVLNEEWAASADVEVKELNQMEVDFLVAINWKVYASVSDFCKMSQHLEAIVASREVASRGWTTYTDLLVMCEALQMDKVWSLLAECALKVTAVCAASYAASLMTMLGTCYLLSKTAFSPNQVSQSMSLIYRSMPYVDVSSSEPLNVTLCEAQPWPSDPAQPDQAHRVSRFSLQEQACLHVEQTDCFSDWNIITAANDSIDTDAHWDFFEYGVLLEAPETKTDDRPSVLCAAENASAEGVQMPWLRKWRLTDVITPHVSIKA